MNYLYDISEYECVGDVLGKINYNFLELENQICQLSAQYFSDGFYTSFNRLSSIIQDLTFLGNQFSDSGIYKQTYTATKLLSSYWNKNEVSVIYPMNIETSDGFTQNYQISSLSTDSILIQKAKAFIDQKFASEDLLNDSSIINVSFLLYDNNGSFTPKTDGPFHNPPVMDSWNITLLKNDYYIKLVKTYVFKKVQNQWINTGKS